MVRFTVHISKGGFTDYLYQFSTFYKLGLSLGYGYLHSPLRNVRSSERVFDFLGFEALFPRPTGMASLRESGLRAVASVVDVPLNDSILADAGVGDFPSLQEYVRALVAARHRALRPTIVRFRWKSETKGRWFFRWVQDAMDRFPDGLDLRNAYFRFGGGREMKPSFPPGRIGVVLHVRQGDTALVRTPWGTAIPQRGPNAFRQVADPGDLETAHSIEVGEYARFLGTFVRAWGNDAPSVRVFSDGFALGIRKVLSRAGEIPLTASQCNSLRESVAQVDEREFAVFDDVPGVTCHVGETDDNLFRLVHATLTADVVIVGDQQKMLPKLLANYADPARPAIVVVLHKVERPPDFAKLGLSAGKATVLPVRAGDDTATAEVARAVRSLIADRTAGTGIRA